MPLPVEASLAHGGKANAIKEPRYNQWAAQIIPKWQVYCGLLICVIKLLFSIIKGLPYLQIHVLELCWRLGITRCDRCISPVPTFVFCQDFIRIAQSDVRSCRSPMESFTEFLGESRRKQDSFHGAFRALVRGHQLKPHHQLRPSQNHHYTYIPINVMFFSRFLFWLVYWDHLRELRLNFVAPSASPRPRPVKITRRAVGLEFLRAPLEAGK